MMINHMASPKVIVVGGFHTDVFLDGVHLTLPADKISAATGLRIAGGGKSPNMARMIAEFLPPRTVLMLGRTIRDRYNLWKPPIESLRKSNVITDHILFSRIEEGRYPGIAFLQNEQNTQATHVCIYRGENMNFTPEDLDSKKEVFKQVGKQKGFLVLSFETPLPILKKAKELGKQHSLHIVIDPGGILKATSEILKLCANQDVFLLKPNHHEAEALTGIKVQNFSTAKKAAHKLLKQGVQNVLITHGRQGAYFFTKEVSKHLPISKESPKKGDAIGCGDQVLGTIVAALVSGTSVEKAAYWGVRAGELQFREKGIKPITKRELFEKASQKSF